MISASHRVETPSRHRRASSPGEEVVGGFFFEFEAVRTAFDGRCSAQVRPVEEDRERDEERQDAEQRRGHGHLCGNQPVRRVHPIILH